MVMSRTIRVEDDDQTGSVNLSPLLSSSIVSYVT